MNDEENKADWVAWTLQFIVGAFVGMVVGILPFSKNRRGGPLLTIDSHILLIFLLGTSLIGAGLASLKGDRLWIGQNYRCIPPDAPKQTRASVTASYVTGISGSLLVVVSLLFQTGYLPKFW